MGNGLEITIADDIDLGETKGFGLQRIQSLASQHRLQVRIERDGRTRFVIGVDEAYCVDLRVNRSDRWRPHELAAIIAFSAATATMFASVLQRCMTSSVTSFGASVEPLMNTPNTVVRDMRGT